MEENIEASQEFSRRKFVIVYGEHKYDQGA